MFDRIGRGIDLARLSLSILGENRSLLLFPLCSFAALALVLASFLLPGWGMLSRTVSGQGTHTDQLNGYFLGFLFYWVNYMVVVFFNTAMLHVVLEKLAGREAGFADGMSRAVQRLPVIVVYASIAATVGLVLRAIEERASFVGTIIAGLIGLVWTVVVALIAPVLAAEDVGPVEAIQRSAELIRNSWGEGLSSNFTIGLIIALPTVIVMAVGGFLSFSAISQHHMVAGVVYGVFTFMLIGLLMLVQAALGSINSAVLYRFANGDMTPGYDTALLQSAFKSKG